MSALRSIFKILVVIVVFLLAAGAYYYHTLTVNAEIARKNQVSQTAIQETHTMYEKGLNNRVIQKFHSGQPIVFEKNLLNFVKILDGLGQDLCSGEVLLEHLKSDAALSDDIGVTCNNEQVVQIASGKNDGFAYLCAEIAPATIFAKTARSEFKAQCLVRQ